MVGIFKRSGQFFHHVLLELKRVKWPTRKELVSYTSTVLITVILLTVFFALIDLGVSALLRLITNQ
ncbi:preprotein translocase subunit SecE [Pullulanibacillus sp. KACC 23026]|uniref:preprotein translocase subunit SecE n=1 Tax=Pullulanibacillus sp. KACC 23026 TaxID=3028315 RepID=UPI0023B18B15|nr:preprotein translocase subunit SecE [Pullulanibacillus sp. KACC 23026]WEG12687.1 preprotein translocase subunit SecE [Pullulanibacillus sp. KACC 23026]